MHYSVTGAMYTRVSISPVHWLTLAPPNYLFW